MIKSFPRKKIFFARKKLSRPKKLIFSRELTCTSAVKSNISRFQIFAR